MEWIKVKDRLPEFHTPILFYVDSRLGIMAGVFYRNSHKFISHGKHTVAEFYKSDVTHWMYMPEEPSSGD